MISIGGGSKTKPATRRTLEEDTLREIFKRIDSNHDGKISFSELRRNRKLVQGQLPELIDNWEAIDDNADGEVNTSVGST